MRAGRSADRFVFAAIVGVPVDLAGQDPAIILGDPRMDYVYIDSGLGLRDACTANNPNGSRRSSATPGRRIVQLAGEVETSVVRSICEDDFSPAIADVTQAIGGLLPGLCLHRPPQELGGGEVACVVEELLPMGASCNGLPGRSFVETDRTTGRPVCGIDPAPDGVGDGWHYEEGDTCDHRIVFTPSAQPLLGSTISLRCLVSDDFFLTL